MSITHRVGVIGQGFVGGAIARGFRSCPSVAVETYDRYIPERSTKRCIADLVAASKHVFVCVPTPTLDDGRGSCDTSIVEDVMGELAATCSILRDDGDPVRRTVVLKSTVPPGTTEGLDRRYRSCGLDVVFNPEFLNARTADRDFAMQDHVILGGDPVACEGVARLYTDYLGDVPVRIMDATAAEVVKYAKNTFFAVKNSCFNTIHQACEKLGVPYEQVREALLLDERVGWEHTRVPGPDGKLSFDGKCLPKDVQAFIVTLERLGVDPCVFEAAWQKKLELRPEADK